MPCPSARVQALPASAVVHYSPCVPRLLIAVLAVLVWALETRSEPGLPPFADRVCLAQPTTAIEIADSETRLRALAAALRDALVERGYGVSMPSAVDAAGDDVARRIGALYDPQTGRLDEGRFQAFQRERYRELSRQLGCTSVLESRVVSVWARWDHGEAHWDGVMRLVGADGGIGGRIKALSVYLTMHDMAGRQVYFSTGGIQLLASRQRFFEVEPMRRPPQVLLADPIELRDAARFGLRALPTVGPDRERLHQQIEEQLEAEAILRRRGPLDSRGRPKGRP